MGLPDVLDADSVLINGGTLSNVRFKINGGVQVALVSQFPGKVVTGDYTRATEQWVSSHTFADWKGGLLVRRMDPTSQADRFWDSQGMDTRFPKQLTISPHYFNVGTVPGAGTATFNAATIYNNQLYAGWSTGDIWVWNHGLTAFSTSPGVVGSASDIKQMVTLRLSSTNWLVASYGTSGAGGLVKFDGTTWTGVAGNGTTVPYARWLAEWDSRLWTLEAGTNKLWYTTDLSSWTARAVLPEYADETQALLVFFDAGNEAVLHAVTKSAVWLYDVAADKWYKTGATFPRHAEGGAGAGTWQGSLYYPSGPALYEYDGRTVRSIGLDREEGLPERIHGNIAGVLDGFRWLFVGTRGVVQGGSATFGNLWVYDRVGWHAILDDDVSFNTTVKPILFGSHDGIQRLWFRVGTSTRYIDFPDGNANPAFNEEARFRAVGQLTTPWFDANWQEQDKLALSLVAECENCAAPALGGRNYSMEVGYDFDETFIPVLITEFAQRTTYAFTTTTSGDGKVFRAIRFRITLSKSGIGGTTETPVFKYLTLRYLPLLDPLYSYSFTVDGSEGHFGDTVKDVFANLQTVLNTDTLLTFKFLKDGQEVVTRLVKGSRFTAQRYPGDDGRFQAALTVAEVG